MRGKQWTKINRFYAVSGLVAMGGGKPEVCLIGTEAGDAVVIYPPPDMIDEKVSPGYVVRNFISECKRVAV